MKLVKEKILPIVLNALSEDVGSGDITSNAVFKKDEIVIAQIVCGQDCVLAGVDVARWVFNSLDEKVVFRPLCNDGDKVKKEKRVISLRGSVKNILAGERTALNFLGRLSGIATLTSEFVNDAVELACLEMLKAGVTTYTDMYFFKILQAKNLRKSG